MTLAAYKYHFIFCSCTTCSISSIKFLISISVKSSQKTAVCSNLFLEDGLKLIITRYQNVYCPFSHLLTIGTNTPQTANGTVVIHEKITYLVAALSIFVNMNMTNMIVKIFISFPRHYFPALNLKSDTIVPTHPCLFSFFLTVSLLVLLIPNSKSDSSYFSKKFLSFHNRFC